VAKGDTGDNLKKLVQNASSVAIRG